MSHTRKQNLLRSSDFNCEAQHLALLVFGEHYNFPGGPKDSHACNRSARIAIDVMLELLKVETPVRIERRGKCGKNAGEEHALFYVTVAETQHAASLPFRLLHRLLQQIRLHEDDCGIELKILVLLLRESVALVFGFQIP